MLRIQLRIGLVPAIVVFLTFLTPSFSSPGQRILPSYAKTCEALERLSSDPKSTRDQWTGVIHSFLEIHRSDKDKRCATHSLFLAGRASIRLYGRGGKTEDLDLAIRWLYEFTKTAPSGPHRIMGLKELKEAHLLKRRISKIQGDRPAPSLAQHRPPGADRVAQHPPRWAFAAKASPVVSRYRYTGNPFCSTGTAFPAATVKLSDSGPAEERFRPVDPNQPAIIQEDTSCPPKPLLPRTSNDLPSDTKSASLHRCPAGDPLPGARLSDNSSKEFLIVIDPGHGGKDPGAVSKDGRIKEKDITLQVANLVKKRLLSKTPGIKVEMTRTDDTFLTLQERTALANSLNADLFISLHCNAASDSSSRGVETFFLSKASSPRAMRMAAKENGISLSETSDLQATLLDLMVTSKKTESDKLANTVHSTLVNNLAKSAPRIRDRGVKRAPFYVLLGAKMPAILVECAFISNGPDEQKLTSSRYLDSVASGIGIGAAKYLRELGGKS